MPVLIVTTEKDLHALIVADTLKKVFAVESYIVEVERLSASYGLCWQLQGLGPGRLLLPDNREVDIEALSLVWWRRVGSRQRLDVEYDDPAHIDLIERDWKAALRGSLISRHRGKWVSHPDATERASNKILQLSVGCWLKSLARGKGEKQLRPSSFSPLPPAAPGAILAAMTFLRSQIAGSGQKF